VEAQLLADDAEVPLRIAGGPVDHVDEHTRALHVAKEGVAEAGTAEAPSISRARRRSWTAIILVAEAHHPRFGSRW